MESGLHYIEKHASLTIPSILLIQNDRYMLSVALEKTSEDEWGVMGEEGDGKVLAKGVKLYIIQNDSLDFTPLFWGVAVIYC